MTALLRSVLSELALLVATPVFAQLGNPAVFVPGSTPQRQPGVVAQHEPNTNDRLFVQLLARGGLAEVRMAEAAVERASFDRVQQFGQWMREAHGENHEKLKTLAGQAGIPVPEQPSDDQRAMVEQLRSLDGASFDLTYLQQQLVSHQQTVNLLLWEIDNGQDPALTHYAADTLAEVTRHLAAVQRLMSEVADVAPQGLGAVTTEEDTARARR